MSYTKRQFIIDALNEIGEGSYIFEASTEQLESVRRTLDRMISQWNGRGVVLSYPLSFDADSNDIDTQTNVPSWAQEAIVTNLAIRIAPSLSKVVSPETKAIAFKSFETLLGRFSKPPEMQLPSNLPRGAGSRSTYWGQDPFFPTPTSVVDENLPFLDQ